MSNCVCVFTYLLVLFCSILFVDHIHALSKYRNPSPTPLNQASSSLRYKGQPF